ncbi:MAG: TMEM165/GDT1 family protein [Proteobacteria bacterium]|nr:TMEM165/GDT1 family protein [Pseudomonadota bacterium]
MNAFLTSIPLVALAEIGDKTQLLSFILAARYRKPVPIILGILAATLVNHGISAWAGAWLATLMDSAYLTLAVSILFLAVGFWVLIPDAAPEESSVSTTQIGPFLASAFAFFVAEIGDKTQLLTVTLAAEYHSLFAVAAGTTVGMLLVNVPAVLLGNRILERVSLPTVHRIAAAIFIVFGIWGLIRYIFG